MAEKKYLEVSLKGVKFGAFENVKEFRDDDNTISFKSDDGNYTFQKDDDGIYRCDDCDIEFDGYNYCGRRALNHHYPEESRVHIEYNGRLNNINYDDEDEEDID